VAEPTSFDESLPEKRYVEAQLWVLPAKMAGLSNRSAAQVLSCMAEQSAVTYQNTTAQQARNKQRKSDFEKKLASPILRHSHFVHSK
jgi:hypothetical protein